jgi:3-hydroxy-9,10-secoandrosta-1,3,5(10)-triene-9,17-dione monooxygenase reductase component
MDGDRMRQVLGHHPTGVTVVTAATAEGNAGFTVGSFSSVSLDPPLVGFLVRRTSRTWWQIVPTGAFCANVLGAGQEELCWRFAGSGDERFAGVAWVPAPSGSPIIKGAVAWVDCDIDDVLPAGDHWMVLGAVRALEIANPCDPLVFHRGRLICLDAGAA